MLFVGVGINDRAAQLLAQARQRAGVNLIHARLGDAHHLPNLLEGQSLIVVELDDLSLALGEVFDGVRECAGLLAFQQLFVGVFGVGEKLRESSAASGRLMAKTATLPLLSGCTPALITLPVMVKGVPGPFSSGRITSAYWVG